MQVTKSELLDVLKTYDVRISELERMLKHELEMRREFINRHNLNKDDDNVQRQLS